MSQYYSDPERESDPHALPDIEVWRAQVMHCVDCGAEAPDPGDDSARKSVLCPDEGCLGVLAAEVPRKWGWWWWYCLPGCLPDGPPVGPFELEEQALADARGLAGPEGKEPPLTITIPEVPKETPE